MPLVGDVRVADLTAEEAENAIAARLRAEQLVKDPEVLVYIQDYESKRFWITGQVDRPGEYAMSQELTMMDAIFMSGGLDFFGEPYAFLHRRVDGTGGSAPTPTTAEHPETAAPGTEVHKIDLTSMRAGGVLVPNPPLRDGDVIVVPTRYPTVFYVLGDVGSPGAFSSNTGQRLTVAQAIATAGGLTRTAKGQDARLIRYTPDGQPEEIPLDYRSILEGESPDFAIESNDVIFVPGRSIDFAESVMRWVPNLALRYPIWR
jgi:polysaccharide export outer membrane protein